MKLSFENFRRRHFQQVEMLCRGIGYRESAKTLCKAAFRLKYQIPKRSRISRMYMSNLPKLYVTAFWKAKWRCSISLPHI